MSTLKTHNLQSPDAGSVNVALTQNAGMVVAGISTFTGNIIANGSVGIGTDNPTTYKLHLQGSTSALARFERTGGSFAKVDIKAGSSSGNSYLTFSDPDASEVGEINYEHADNSLRFNTNSSERLRITSDGKVGVNQSTWTSKDHMFEVNQSTNDKEIARFTNTGGISGDVQGKGFIGLSAFNSTTYPHAYIGVEEDGTGNYQGHLTFATRNASNDSIPTERLRITSDGKIGIGITNPIYDIQISGNYGIGKTSANGSYGNFVPYNGSTGNMEFNLNWPGGSTESMIFNIMGNERMRITSDGDILIGTNNKGISFANSSSSPDADSTSSTRVITDYDEGTCDWEIHRSDGLTLSLIHI